jgi:hypothetical protein
VRVEEKEMVPAAGLIGGGAKNHVTEIYVRGDLTFSSDRSHNRFLGKSWSDVVVFPFGNGVHPKILEESLVMRCVDLAELLFGVLIHLRDSVIAHIIVLREKREVAATVNEVTKCDRRSSARPCSNKLQHSGIFCGWGVMKSFGDEDQHLISGRMERGGRSQKRE